MKKLTYLNVILTIIAVNLTILTLRGVDLIPTVQASSPAEKATLNSTQGDPIEVKIVDIDTYDALKVDLSKVSSRDKLDVDIAEISTYDELEVEIERSVDLNVKMK